MARIQPFYESLGRRLQSLRARRRITQEQLGSRLTPPMTRASVANIESGKQRVLAHTLLQLADALDVPLTELVPAQKNTHRPAGRRELEAELTNKLSIPRRRIAALAAKLTNDGRGGQL